VHKHPRIYCKMVSKLSRVHASVSKLQAGFKTDSWIRSSPQNIQLYKQVHPVTQMVYDMMSQHLDTLAPGVGSTLVFAGSTLAFLLNSPTLVNYATQHPG
jgi:hypothetical protein